ncbi:hypothetical protein GCM10025786_05840 [Nocardioides caeni]
MQEPLPRLLERVLRDLVVAQARCPVAEEDRSAATLHVGIPGRRPRRFRCESGGLDQALRVEIVEAMARDSLADGQVPLVWLTRAPDGPDLEDLAWATSTGAAGAELGVLLEMVVITRRSWADPRSGAGRTWTRVRPGPRADQPD